MHRAASSAPTILRRFVRPGLDRGLEPVWFDDQQVARQMFQCAFCCRTDEKTLPAIACNGTHNDNIRLEAVGNRRQFLVCQTGNQVRIRISEAMKRCDLIEALLMILMHLPFDFIKRQ